LLGKEEWIVGTSRSRKPALVSSRPTPAARYSTVNYNAQHRWSTHGDDSTLTIAVDKALDGEGVE